MPALNRNQIAEIQFTFKPYEVEQLEKLKQHFPGATTSDILRMAIQMAIKDKQN